MMQIRAGVAEPQHTAQRPGGAAHLHHLLSSLNVAVMGEQHTFTRRTRVLFTTPLLSVFTGSHVTAGINRLPV